MSYFDDASLVMIPSGYKTSKVYSVKPTDGTGDLTFSRSNDTATRVNSAGLIEKVRTNVALYSEDQTNWTIQNETSVTANAAANPLNGAVTADKVIPSTTTDDHYRGLSMGSMVGEISSSIYVKADGYSIIDYGIYNATAANYPVRAVFDLSTQAITYINGSIASITSIGSGWYRISVTGSVASTSTMGIFHRVRPSGTGGTYAGNGTSGMLLWGCQLESGVTTPYIGPTTSAAVSVGPVANVPRLDYLGSTCGKLILEPQRTNLTTDSETIVASTGTTVSLNNAASPDGYVNADKLVEDTSTGVHQTFFSTSLGGSVDSSAYCISIFAKAAGRSRILFYDNNQNTSGVTTFDLSSGTIVSGGGKIENYGNGWYRCTIFPIKNFSTTSSAFIQLISTGTTTSYTGDGTSGALLWGRQVEAGAYATSYIPTLGAAVTRGGDGAYKTSATALIGQTEGVIFLDFIASAQNQDGQGYSVISIFGTTTENIQLYTTGATLKWYAFKSGIIFDQTADQTLVAGQRYKVAIAYKSGDWALYINGVQKRTRTETSIPATSQFNFNSDSFGTGVAQVENKFNQALIFKTRLSNADLAALTA